MGLGLGRADAKDGRTFLSSLERQNAWKCRGLLNFMTRNGRRKRKKLSSSSSLEGSSILQDEVSGPQMASEGSIDEAPSPADMWKVLTEIQSNTDKLVNDVDLLKVHYKELQENLASTKVQVDILMK